MPSTLRINTRCAISKGECGQKNILLEETVNRFDLPFQKNRLTPPLSAFDQIKINRKGKALWVAASKVCGLCWRLPNEFV